MSTLGDALKALKKVILIEENVSRLGQDVSSLTADIRRTRDYAQSIELRVVRIEGVMEGYSRAASTGAKGGRRKLPKE